MQFQLDTLTLLGHLSVIAGLFLLMLRLRRWPRIYAALTWPGTLAHEFLHYLAGLLTGARPVSLTIIPRKQTDGTWVLGEVAFARLRWWNSVPVALAPLALFPIGGWIVWQSAVLPVLDWSGAGLKQLAILCLMAAWPSRQDWAHAWAGMLVILVLASISFTVFYLIDAQVVLNVLNKWLQP